MSMTSPLAQHPDRTGASSSEFDDFVYLISHDVRNSVRALIELPQWIEEDLSDAGVRLEGPVRDSIDLMNRHTGRLDRMLVDLLTFSRVGRMQTVSEVDLDEALTTVLDEIRVPSGFQVVRVMDCPTLMIGETDIMTLFNALISNAVKHHDHTFGKILVTTHLEGDNIVLSVRDDGPGIPEKYHERIFEAMTTLRPRDEVEGSGMGLAITRKIASLYHGTVSVRSSGRARSTTVEVRFPGYRRSQFS